MRVMVQTMPYPSSKHDACMQPYQTSYVEQLSTVGDNVDDRLAATVQAGRRNPGGMGAASRAVGAPFVTVAGTRVCSDVVLQSLDFRKALNTIGSGNVRAKCLPNGHPILKFEFGSPFVKFTTLASVISTSDMFISNLIL